LMAMMAAHFALLPLPSSEGREARSAQAVAANEICTEARVKIAVFPRGLRSLHFFLGMSNLFSLGVWAGINHLAEPWRGLRRPPRDLVAAAEQTGGCVHDESSEYGAEQGEHGGGQERHRDECTGEANRDQYGGPGRR